MKRTLKRESKVLEIVRREAIGAGMASSCCWTICSTDSSVSGSLRERSRLPVRVRCPGRAVSFSPRAGQHRFHVVEGRDIGWTGPIGAHPVRRASGTLAIAGGRGINVRLTLFAREEAERVHLGG